VEKYETRESWVGSEEEEQKSLGFVSKHFHSYVDDEALE
jgi:hypothetical protein